MGFNRKSPYVVTRLSEYNIHDIAQLEYSREDPEIHPDNLLQALDL